MTEHIKGIEASCKAAGVPLSIMSISMQYDDLFDYEKGIYCQNGEDCILAKHFFGNRPKLIGFFRAFVRGQVHYANEIKNLEEMVKSSCDEEIYFFEEEINNYIDIARSVESGEASTSKIDYEYLAKKVGEIVKDYTKQQLTDMYITFYSEKPLTSFDKRKIASPRKVFGLIRGCFLKKSIKVGIIQSFCLFKCFELLYDTVGIFRVIFSNPCFDA